MKNGIETSGLGRASSADNFVNRKLIRPVLNREPQRGIDGNLDRREPFAQRGGQPVQLQAVQKKTAPPEQTHAENFYYQKQIQTQTPIVVVTCDGEQLHGTLEWYDKKCIKLVCPGGSGTVLIYKSSIRYMYKEGEASGNR